jgi:3-oxoacyl-[acyl-carrier protein] reductase
MNKVAIVTGASKGIGSAISAALAAAGARVAVNYSSDSHGAERVAQTIIAGGGEAIAVGADPIVIAAARERIQGRGRRTAV